MEKYFIGIDGGSQSNKVIIYNQKGVTICSASAPIRPMIHRQSGYVEHPDDDLWDGLQVVLKEVMAKFKGDVNAIQGLGLCTIRCCRVFMKKDGSLAEPVMSWMDIRSYEKYEDDERIAYTCPTTGYIAYRLTGEKRDTSANAFQWQFPIDVHTWDWSEDQEYFDSFQIPREKLFDLQMPGTILGYVTEEASKLTGLPIGIPVVATGNDKAVEALGCGLVDDNLGLISLGTYLTSMIKGKEYIADSGNFFTNLSCVPNEYLYESNGIRYGMAHISWLKNIIGEEFANKAKEKGVSVEDLLEEEAKKVPAGSDGLLTIPQWLAPAGELYKKGAVIGFTSLTTRGHIYRSMLEGIAMTIKSNYDAMIQELAVKPDKVIISGGGSNSDLFMQIFADMYGVSTIRNEVNGSASLGAAICTAVATGEYKNFREAAKAMVRIKDEFKPNTNIHKIYSEINENVYGDLSKNMEPILKKIDNTYQNFDKSNS